MRELATVKEELLHTLSFLDFNHVFNLIVRSNDKSILKCRHVQQKKLRNLIPGYKPEISLDSHDPENVISNFPSHVQSDSKKSLPYKGLSFALPPKKIDYADFLAQFELLYRDNLEFNFPSEKSDFYKNKLKDILNSCNFDKINTNLIESECRSLKELIQRKDLVIQKTGKGNTVVINNRENYLKGMKSLFSDNSKFILLNNDKNKWLNYIVNLEIELKENFRTSENNKKISEDEYKSICSIGTHPGILYGLPKVHKILIANIPKFRPILSAIGTPV